jgi:hypothetical protein
MTNNAMCSNKDGWTQLTSRNTKHIESNDISKKEIKEAQNSGRSAHMLQHMARQPERTPTTAKPANKQRHRRP